MLLQIFICLRKEEKFTSICCSVLTSLGQCTLFKCNSLQAIFWNTFINIHFKLSSSSLFPIVPVIIKARNALSGIFCPFQHCSTERESPAAADFVSIGSKWDQEVHETTVIFIWVRTVHVACMYAWDGTHPWQLAHSSSSTETSSRTVRALRVTARTSCPLPSHDAAPLSAAAPDPTTPASGPHHTPLSAGAMMHHTGEDMGWVPAEGNKKTIIIIFKLCHFFNSLLILKPTKWLQIIVQQWLFCYIIPFLLNRWIELLRVRIKGKN